LRGGIEYTSHVMQGSTSIGRTTSHELAHQWFYGLVGNNQGRDPWLDEGLATYAEGRAESSLGELQRLSVPADGKGHLTSPISYWNAHQPSYYRGVYAQGAQALASLGPVDRVDCALRLYVARNAYRIARPADLLDALSVVIGDAPAKLAAYGVTSTP
jgi:aminopeptidase N